MDVNPSETRLPADLGIVPGLENTAETYQTVNAEAFQVKAAQLEIAQCKIVLTADKDVT